jgi:hypothetical protein
LNKNRSMYTITLNTNKTKAEAIFKFLKAFNVDFDIIDASLSKEQTKELNKRLTYSLTHPDDGISWEEMEKGWKDEEKI